MEILSTVVTALALCVLAIICYLLGKLIGKNAPDEVQYLKNIHDQIRAVWMFATAAIIVVGTKINPGSILLLAAGVSSVLQFKNLWRFSIISIISVFYDPTLASTIALLQCSMLIIEGSLNQ